MHGRKSTKFVTVRCHSTMSQRKKVLAVNSGRALVAKEKQETETGRHVARSRGAAFVVCACVSDLRAMWLFFIHTCVGARGGSNQQPYVQQRQRNSTSCPSVWYAVDTLCQTRADVLQEIEQAARQRTVLSQLHQQRQQLVTHTRVLSSGEMLHRKRAVGLWLKVKLCFAWQPISSVMKFRLIYRFRFIREVQVYEVWVC